MAENNLEIAQKIQEKFEFYLLGIIFTVLGLSIQTAKFGASGISDALELMGWFSLLISAFAGLSRLEWTPRSYLGFDWRDTLQAQKKEMTKYSASGIKVVLNSSTGRDQSVSSATTEIEQKLEQLEGMLKIRERELRIKYRVEKWGFGAGITLLVVARAYLPLVNIGHKVALYL